jgi:hypothetical protein
VDVVDAVFNIFWGWSSGTAGVGLQIIGGRQSLAIIFLNRRRLGRGINWVGEMVSNEDLKNMEQKISTILEPKRTKLECTQMTQNKRNQWTYQTSLTWVLLRQKADFVLNEIHGQHGLERP